MVTRPLVRAASTSAAAVAASTSSSASAASSTLSAYLLLSRPPTILRSPTSFESAYHAYNSKLQQALAQPFPREVYFKKGSAAENKFLQEEEERRRRMFSGNKSNVKSEKEIKEKTTQAEISEIEGQDLYRTVSRRTKADEENRLDSLERSLDRNLFLLVKGGEMGNDWTLPFTKLEKGGSGILHKAAPQVAHSLFGKEMDIWMVSNLPIGLLSNASGGGIGYVMLGHILAGQPDPSTSKSKGVEYAWLTREEIEERIGKEHWKGIKDLLSV
jgi:large subunit ribosomal protein L46